MNKNRLKSTIIEQREDFVKARTYIDRVIPAEFVSGRKISVITGVRRCGKSTLLKQIADKSEGFYYLNFEDERLLDFVSADFDTVLEIFYELYGEGKIFLFDEIQEVKAWEKFIRRLFEQGEKIFVTGSNAKLLSSELSTALSGRHLRIELYPLSFSQYLLWNKFKFKENYTTKDKALIAGHLREYLEFGGFPEIIASRSKEELRQLYQDILIKDLLVRFKIRDSKSFREIALYLLSNTASPISFNSLAKIIGIKSVTTVKNYVDNFSEAYLFFSLFKFDYSVKKQLINDRKIYAIDTGIINAIAFKFSANSGHILENIVFLELKRRGQEIYYHKNKKECDFILRKGTKIFAVIQVAYSLADKKTREREISGLLEALSVYKLKEGLIITFDEEDEENIGDYKIKIVPVWKWLIGKLSEPLISA